MLRPCACFVMFAPLLAQAPVSVAMVTDVQGKATAAKGALVESLALTTELAAGSRIEAAAGARLVFVTFTHGEEIRVTGPAAFTLDAQGRPHGAKKGVQVVPVKGVQLREALKPGGLAQASLVMRAPSTGDFALTAPQSPVIQDPRPTFAWETAGPGATYTFILKELDGPEVLREGTDAPEFVLPVDQPLRVGTAYHWEVRARRDGAQRQAQGELRVLGLPQRLLLRKLRDLAKSRFSMRLAYAAALQQFGLAVEAKAEWKALQAQRPEDPVLQSFAR